MKRKIAITVTSLTIILLAYSLYEEKKNSNHPFYTSEGQVLNISHRGAMGLAPENTILAFRKAVDSGSDILELDIRATSDSALVLLHDSTVDRTTDGNGEISKLKLKQVKELNAGFNWTHDDSLTFPYRALNLSIPTLEEFLMNFRDTRLNIEIKQHDLFVAIELCDILVRNNIESSVVVASFSSDIIEEFRRNCPEILTSPGMDEIKLLYGLNYIGMDKFYHPKSDIYQLPEYFKETHVLTKRLIESLKRKNIPIFVWTVNDTSEMRRFIELGVDGIISDFPERLSKVLMSNKETIN